MVPPAIKAQIHILVVKPATRNIPQSQKPLTSIRACRAQPSQYPQGFLSTAGVRMQRMATDKPIPQIHCVSGKFISGSPTLRPKAAKVAKNTTNASKLSTMEASALFDDLLFFNFHSLLHQAQNGAHQV